jgi:hypothetical protein
VSEKIEPQNTEQGIMNVEGKENFIISACGGFDIRYSNKEPLIVPGFLFPFSSFCLLTPDT